MNWSFSPDQMTALEEYLDSRADSDKLLLVPAHFPIDDAGGRGDATNAAAMKTLLSAYDLPIVFMWGHNHSEADKPYSDMNRILKEYPISYTTVNAGAIGYREPADSSAWQGLNLTVDLTNNQLNYSVIGNSSEGLFRVVGTHTQALPTSGPSENAQMPAIQTQPGSTTVTIGTPVSLSVAATVGSGTLSYQWFANTVNANSGGTIIPGAVAASYSPPTAVLGQYWYYCKITNTDTTATVNQTAVIYSDAASVQVQATQSGWDGSIASSYGGGSGTAADPWLISNAAELARLAQETNAGTDYDGKFFRQTADINLNNQAWTPIGGYVSSSSGNNRVFAGTYDGGGKLVRNLHIDLTVEGSSSLPKTYGLFGYVSGTIMNIGVVGADVSFVNTQTGSSNTNAYVGIIAGYLGNNSTPAAKILNSFATGNAYAQTSASGTTVLCCAGGITGYVYSGEIRNSYASATVSNGGSFSSQYSGYGGIVGQIRSGETFADVSWNNELTGYGAAGSSSSVSGLTGKTTAALKAESYLDDLNDAATGQTGWLEWMADTTPALNDGYPLHLRQINVIVDAQVPEILTQPIALAVAPNGAATLSIVAAVDRGTLSYQWYYNDTDFNSGGTLIVGAVSATYSPPTDTIGQIWYYCKIINTDTEATGDTTSFINSDTASVIVSEAPPVWDGSIASSYGGGSGTAADPWLISNAAELARLAQETNAGTDYDGKFFYQTADIDLGDLAWTPIGGYISSSSSGNRSFAGTYDGGGKLVKGLKIDLTAEGSSSLFKSYGLFGRVKGTIMNIGVVEADVSFINTQDGSSNNNAYVGIIAGYLGDGEAPAARIINSFATGSAYAQTNRSFAYCCAGGLAGYVYVGEISNSYASATTGIGGSYSASSSGYGGAVGQIRSGETFAGVSWNSDLTAYGAAGSSSSVSGLTGKTTAALKAESYLDDLNDAATGQTGWLEWMADTSTALNGGYPLHLRQINVIIPISGTVGTSGVARFGSALTVGVNGVMPAEARVTLSYVWLRDGAAIPGATGISYTITAADIGCDIAVRVTASGDYSGELTSSTVTALKALTIAPAAPTLNSASTDTITLNTIAGQEYRLGSEGAWQTSGIFSGLVPDTSYDLYTRIAETETALASPASLALTVSTEAQIIPISGTVSTTGVARFGSALTAGVNGVMPAEARVTLSYIWLRDGAAIPGATGISYTITAADIGCEIAVRVTASSDYSGELTSGTVTALKALTIAPAAPTLNSASTDTITLNTIAGQEYRLGSEGAWQTSGIFGGLVPDTSYDLYTRIAETETALASPASLALTVSTHTTNTQIGGVITISGTTRYGSVITAAVEGVTPAAARETLRFIWLRNGRIIPGAYSSSYMITTQDIGRYISVIVIAGSGYSGMLISGPVRVEKAIATSPAAPTLKGVTTNKITLNKVAGQQYRLGNGPWQNSAVFTGLRPNTSYQFYTRKAETYTTMASPPSAVAVFKTNASTPQPPQPPFFYRIAYMPVRFGFYYIYIPYVVMVRNNHFRGF